MAFDIRVSGEHAKVVLSGDVDLQTTADLKSEIQSVTDVTRLEIEAANVTYIDSSGVAVLLLARQHCAQNNITLSMPAVSEAVHRVLQIAKLDAMLPIGEVVAAADTGLMGLGVAEGAEAPADDDDLVNALLADDAADPGMVDSGMAAAWATLARIMVVPVLAIPALKGWISARSISPSRPKQPPTRRRMQMMPVPMVTVRMIRSCLAPSARPIRARNADGRRIQRTYHAD